MSKSQTLGFIKYILFTRPFILHLEFRCRFSGKRLAQSEQLSLVESFIDFQSLLMFKLHEKFLYVVPGVRPRSGIS